MVNVYNNFAGKIKKEDIFILLQVHDELVFEIKNEFIEMLLPKIKEAMIKPAKDLNIDIPIILDFAQGRRWGEMQDIVV